MRACASELASVTRLLTSRAASWALIATVRQREEERRRGGGEEREAQRAEEAGKLAFFFQTEAMNKFRPYEAASDGGKKEAGC